MKITAMKPFGVELGDVQIAAADVDLATTVQNLLARHRVAVFRNQTGDDADLVRFLGSLGPLMFTAGEVPVPDAPDLNLVSNAGRIAPPRSVFHTDTVCRTPASIRRIARCEAA